LGAALLSCGFGAIWMYTRASTSDPWEAAPAPEKALAQEGVPPYLSPTTPDPDRWTEQDFFGCALALNTAGTRMIVGEVGHPNDWFEGNVYVFDLSGGVWTRSQAIVGANLTDGSYLKRLFGWAVAGTPSLSRIFISAPYADNERGSSAGTVYVFDADETADPSERYSLVDRIVSPVVTNAVLPLPNIRMVRAFGSAVSCDSTGELVAIGASDTVSTEIDIDQEILPSQGAGEGLVTVYAYEPVPPPTYPPDSPEPDDQQYNSDEGLALLYPYRPLVPVTEALEWTTDVVEAYTGPRLADAAFLRPSLA
jgi:hypothetical protein